MRALLRITALSLTGCIGSTKYGDCMGIVQDGDKSLRYELSIWNAFIAIILGETIIVPIVWAVNSAKCPEGVNNVPTK